MATNPSRMKYTCMPFELYINAFTEKWHLLKYTGMTADGRACTLKVLGTYDKEADGLKAYEKAVKKGI